LRKNTGFSGVRRRRGARGLSPFSPELIQAVTRSLTRREQVILALNRRGFSTFMICHNCGFVWRCTNCQVALVHHRDPETGKDQLQCHYCFVTKNLPEKCEECKAAAVFLGGFGTQKLVPEAKRTFPSARILRMDRDAARKKSAPEETYRAFKEEAADILIGTQMVTQGFDFPRVTLVGIIDADTALHHPDFRAGERAFQWIAQASGRAGRSAMGGEVIVQTRLPDHYALRAADYRAFYAQEIEFRRALFYPPFSKLALFRFQSATHKEQVVKDAEALAVRLEGERSLDAEAGRIDILGPGPAPREHLRSQLRWQILVKCEKEKTRAKLVRIARGFSPKSGVRMVIDVDPYDLL
jgi:primosomal protein N' (replication factor Y)